MSAPTTERARGPRSGAVGTRGARATAARSAARTATIPAQRGVPSVERGGATGRAYARRDDRLRKLVVGRAPRNAPTAGRAKFVLLVMALLATGLIVTLWLSTAAAADSYRLQDARVAARALSEQSEQLRREVTAMDAAPALAQRAASLGMVPVQDSARLVVAPDGSVTVAGTPKAAVATAPPAPLAPPAAPNGATSTDAGAAASATAAPNGTDPNTPTADAAAAAGLPVTTATPATPAPTATPPAGATSAPATPTAAASRTAAAANGARTAAAATTTATATATATAKPTAKPTAAARTSAPAGGTR